MRYVFIKGSSADPNADFLHSGQLEVLDKAIKSGDIKVVGEQYTDGWLPENAQKNMEQILTANDNKVDAVVASNDGTAGGVVAALTCPHSLAEVTAERALLAYLDGSCQTPIAASARLHGDQLLTLDGMILSTDGQAAHRFEMDAPAADAEALGKAVGAKLLEMAGGRDFLA